MPSSRDVELSERASSDVADILQYTLMTWGLTQRDDYALALDSGFEQIGLFPEIETPTNRLRNGRTYRIREHTVYYQVHDDVIYVVRVLHHKMDARRDLFE